SSGRCHPARRGPGAAGAGLSAGLEAAVELDAAANSDGIVAGYYGPGPVARGADLSIQHGHRAADPGQDRAGFAQPPLWAAPGPELPLFRCPRLELDLQPG